MVPETEDYDEDTAAAQVRRVLDIVACTTCFGPSSPDAERNAQDKNSGKKSSKAMANAKQSSSSPPPPAPSSANDGEGEMSNSCPQLGSFYEFFSLSHLTPPLQCKYLFRVLPNSETKTELFSVRIVVLTMAFVISECMNEQWVKFGGKSNL